jgi:WD40 repeat protein
LKCGRIYVIESASGEIVRKVEGHAASVNGWCTDEERAWSCGGDGKVKCWDSRTGNCVA